MLLIPGKLFILGEYSVMCGGKAIIVALRPGKHSQEYGVNPHPDSPAGKFISENQLTGPIRFKHMESGFGSSTAELIAANRLLKKPWDDRKLWQWYRKNFAPSSGADLAVQLHAMKNGFGIYSFKFQDADYHIEKLMDRGSWLLRTFLFQGPQAGKLKTYEAIRGVNPTRSVAADSLLDIFKMSWTADVYHDFVQIYSSFVSSSSKDITSAMRTISGVEAVKGCGAGFHDSFIATVTPDSSFETEKELRAVAEKHQLKFMGALRDYVAD